MELEVAGHRTEVVFAKSAGQPSFDQLVNCYPFAVVYDTGALSAAGIHGVDISLPGINHKIKLCADEQHKTWSSVESILGTLLDNGAGRDDVLLGIGGGVLTDVAAFAASIYMRGIECVLAPTTLLAMVDAAFGGKTGMNYGGYKNMVGTFWPSSRLIIQVDFLRSLPDHELRSGMGEVFKSAMLKDPVLWRMLQQQGAALMAADRQDELAWQSKRELWLEIVRRSLAVKGAVVAADFRESGQRAFLNLGHTFGHAAESILGFGAVPHGTLVVWGIVQAMRLGVRLGITRASWCSQVEELAVELGYPLQIKLPAGKSIEDLIIAMRSDKKKRSGQVRFVLQADQSETLLQPVDESDLRGILADGVIT
ncbi:MAG: 3-dehydroquinate synthase [Spirochaetaceae bacterium]|nr:MAG: 3-dehydroquinate synthase [Spirochaetaceae bacterium]